MFQSGCHWVNMQFHAPRKMVELLNVIQWEKRANHIDGHIPIRDQRLSGGYMGI